MNKERDKFLTEVMGGCWHVEGLNGKCEKCGTDNFLCSMQKYEKGFSKWAGFGKLFEWSQKQDWFELDFCYRHMGCHSGGDDHTPTIDSGIINPDNFANAVYEFLKEKEN